MSVFSAVIDICLMGGVVPLAAVLAVLHRAVRGTGPDEKGNESHRAYGPVRPGPVLIGTAFGYFLLTPSTIRVAFELNQMLGLYRHVDGGPLLQPADVDDARHGVRPSSFRCWWCWRCTWASIEVATLRKYPPSRHRRDLIHCRDHSRPDPRIRLTRHSFAVPLIVLYEPGDLGVGFPPWAGADGKPSDDAGLVRPGGEFTAN